MFITKKFGLYQITFGPPPIQQGVYLSFDTLKEIDEHIEKNKDVNTDAWIIVGREDGVSNYKFIRCEPIKK